MFVTKMKVNIVRRKGVQWRPSGPIVWRMIPSWTKSTVASATFWTPWGTSSCLRLAMYMNANTMITDRNINRTTLLMPPGKISGHSMTWLIGGNSMPRTFTVSGPPCLLVRYGPRRPFAHCLLRPGGRDGDLAAGLRPQLQRVA